MDGNRMRIENIDIRAAIESAQHLMRGESECPKPARADKKDKRGRIKKCKSRNLLERLRDFPDDVLRSKENEPVSFSNNLGENDICVTKVQKKISGCFRSIQEPRYTVESAATCRHVASRVSRQAVRWNDCVTASCRNLRGKRSIFF